jgi:hypothetical protein
MGGLAFAKAGPDGSPLNVPRIPHDVYKTLVADFQSRLQSLFQNVIVPREPPGKLDHGDIDFLVEGALCEWNFALIKEALGATHAIEHGRSTSFAVPYADSPERYVQVDVEISPGDGTTDSAALFKWNLFMKSYSDLLQIIGICHRPFGITSNDKGLHIRVEEIEVYNKRKSLLFLTHDPDMAMKFFGLDASKYWAGFQTEQELFQWVFQGRFVNSSVLEEREENATDRARHKKRPMYQRFVDEFLPSRTEPGVQSPPWTREQVLEEALEMFDKRSEYQAMLEVHSLRERDIAIWERIKETLPVQGNPLNITLRGLRRWVDFRDGQPFIASAARLTDQPNWAEAVADEDSVISWVAENWEEVRALEKARAVSLDTQTPHLSTRSNTDRLLTCVR